jgi:maltose-binding protein MalE
LIDSLQPLAWSQASYTGTVTSLPLELQGVVLYRNRALAAQPIPDFDSWLKSARATSDKFPKESVLDLGFQYSGSQLAACGGTLLKAGGGIGFDQATGVCWLSLLARFREAGPLTFDKPFARATFLSGHSPWLIGLTSDEAALRAAIGKDQLAIDPWPAYPATGKRLAGYVWTENAYMIAGARPQDQDAAWALMLSLLAPEAQTRFASADGARWLSVLRSVAAGDDLLRQALVQLTTGVAMPLAADMAIYSVPLGRAVFSVAGQGGDPGVALKRATELIHNQLSISPPGG